MNYEKGCHAMFKAITDLTELYEKMDIPKEYLEMPHFLRAIQAKGEEACIADQE